MKADRQSNFMNSDPNGSKAAWLLLARRIDRYFQTIKRPVIGKGYAWSPNKLLQATRMPGPPIETSHQVRH